jgi:ribosomal protein S18 acetylase RimI-like enzyme
MNITIREIREATPEVLQAVNRLLPQLSDSARPISLNQLEDILNQVNFYLIGAYLEQKIVGMATICYHKTITKPRGFGHIEDVVVDRPYRDKGIGSQIMDELHKIAKVNLLEKVKWTSNPEREPANKMYQRLGFKPIDDNVYEFTPSEI